MGNIDAPITGDAGFTADVRTKRRDLRLLSLTSMYGCTAIVYDMNAQQEITRESVDDLDKGKRRAEQLAQDYLKEMDDIPLPTIEWKANEKMLKSRSLK